MDIPHALSNYVRETFNHGLNPSEVNWGRNLKLNYTSGGLNISEIDWGDHDPSTNNMNEILLSEVDWGAFHDSSFCLFLVNIDCDAKPKDFFTQESWGVLPERTSSTTLMGLTHEEGKLVHHLELQKGPSRLDHQLDQQWDPSQSLDHLLSSSDTDQCPSPCLSYTITLLLVGHSYYLMKKLGRDLTSTSLMAYLKYSFDINKDLPTSYQSNNMEAHTLSLTLDNMKVVTPYLTNGILGRNLCSLNSSGKLP